MNLRRTALPLFLLVLCLLALASSGFGQTETATLSGLITDPQGKVVPTVDVAHSLPIDSVVHPQKKRETIRLCVFYNVLGGQNHVVTFPSASCAAPQNVSHPPIRVVHVRE